MGKSVGDGIRLIGYRRGVLGPRFWAVVGFCGLGFGWFSHFSPFTGQLLSAIFHAYPFSFAGGVTVSIFVALMLTVLLATVQAIVGWGMSTRAGTRSLP